MTRMKARSQGRRTPVRRAATTAISCCCLLCGSDVASSTRRLSAIPMIGPRMCLSSPFRPDDVGNRACGRNFLTPESGAAATCLRFASGKGRLLQSPVQELSSGASVGRLCTLHLLRESGVLLPGHGTGSPATEKAWERIAFLITIAVRAHSLAVSAVIVNLFRSSLATPRSRAPVARRAMDRSMIVFVTLRPAKRSCPGRIWRSL